MKQVKNINNLKNQLVQFNQKAILGGDGIVIVVPPPPPVDTRVSTGQKIGSAKDNG